MSSKPEIKPTNYQPIEYTGPAAVNSYTMRVFIPVEGDWFQVEAIPDYITGREEEYYISRVLMWVLIQVKGEIDRIEAITHEGHPKAAMGDDGKCYYYAKGTDNAPDGGTWNEHFDKAIPSARFGDRNIYLSKPAAEKLVAVADKVLKH